MKYLNKGGKFLKKCGAALVGSITRELGFVNRNK